MPPPPESPTSTPQLPEAARNGIVELSRLPEAVTAGLWPLLELALTHPGDPASVEQLRGFACEHALDEHRLLAAVQGGDYLLRRAAAEDLAEGRFAEQIASLLGAESPARRLLQDRYPQVRNWLREQALLDTLADHGNVLTGLEWRLDRVQASHRGHNLETPVLFLKLTYRSGEGEQQLSLQLTPDGLASLGRLCERFSG